MAESPICASGHGTEIIMLYMWMQGCACSDFFGSCFATSTLVRRSRYGDIMSRSMTAHLYAAVTAIGVALAYVPD